MPGKILGLDIHAKSLTAVQVTSGLKGSQITACAHVLFREDQGLEDVLSELAQELDLKSDLCISSIPAEDVSFRNLSLPFRDTKKIRQTLPYELEPLVPFSLNELVVDFQVSSREDRSEVLAVSARKSLMADYLSRLQSRDIDPEVIEVQPAPMISWLINQDETPENGLFLYLDSNRSSMSLYLNKRIVLMRTFSHKQGHRVNSSEDPLQVTERLEAWIRDLSMEINKTLHALKWQQGLTAFPEKIFFTGPGARFSGMNERLTRFMELPAEQVNISRDPKIGMDATVSRTWDPALMDTALSLALRDGRKGSRFNLRQGEFERQKPYLGIKKELRRLGLILIFVLSFFIADLCVDYYFIKNRYMALKGRVEEAFHQAIPNEPYTADAVLRIQQKIQDIKKGSTSIPGIRSDQRMLDLMLDISRLIPKEIDVLMTRMVFDPEIIRISGETDNFNSVDSIKNSIGTSNYFKEATISSANLDKNGKRVKFELKLQRVE